MSETRLGRDVFVALAAVGWADGQLDPDEADAIVRTAVEEGLPLEEIAEIEEATKKPFDLGEIDRSAMTKEDLLFVYAVASWMTRLDGVVAEEEVEALRKLGDQLRIPDVSREHVDEMAQQIADLPDGDRPDRYDLPRLRRVIGARLALAERLRSAQDK
jgi:uncharacterized membrane protein YebE (DUF533 family)